jgi:hypothetical protein
VYRPPVPRTFCALLATIAACLVTALPAAAQPLSYQGTLSAPVVSADGSSVSAQIDVTALCDGASYCGFWPLVTTVPATEACSDTISGSSWVGSVVSPPYGSASAPPLSAIATWHEWPSLFSGAKRACLYAMSSPPIPVLVAQADYLVPAPPPLPTPPVYVPPAAVTPVYVPPVAYPPGSATDALPQSLSRTEAIRVMRTWLKKKYGRRWTKGRSRTVKCPVRTSDAQLGCFGVWIYRGQVRSKSAVITETEDSYLFSNTFGTAPSQADAPGSDSGSAGGDFCSTHVCIPNYPNGTGTTVQCADGAYSQSGGKQGACSGHGGVSHAMRVRSRPLTRPHARARNASQRARVDAMLTAAQLTELRLAQLRVANAAAHSGGVVG